jgi:hypothetical protein
MLLFKYQRGKNDDNLLGWVYSKRMSIGLALGFVCQNWASIHGSNFL